MTLQTNIEKFHELIKKQMIYGGKKYALSNKRESTDEIFEYHGKNWLFGTCDKYTYRFANLARERDLLKVPCYMYILWLKRGFFFKKGGLTDVLDTTIEVKEKHFSMFSDSMLKILEQWRPDGILDKFQNRSEKDKLKFISSTLKHFSQKEWTDVTERLIIGIYFSCYLIWFPRYAHIVKHDEDLQQNEDKK